MNSLRENISTQFKGEAYRRTPCVHQTVLEHFFVVLDGLIFLVFGYFSTYHLGGNDYSFDALQAYFLELI